MKVYIATEPDFDGEGDTILGVYDNLERAIAACSPRINTHWEHRLYRNSDGKYYQLWDSDGVGITEHDIVTEGPLWERAVPVWAEAIGKITPTHAITLLHD